jgi:3-methylcrotonyl-CoA carboxylase alpha subunit
MSWLHVDVRGKTLRVAIVRSGDGVLVSWGGIVRRVLPESASVAVSTVTERDVRAPMTGRVVKVAAAVGASVRARDTLIVLEAMKMEYRLTAPRDGIIEAVRCSEGERVDLGRVLVILSP